METKTFAIIMTATGSLKLSNVIALVKVADKFHITCLQIINVADYISVMKDQITSSNLKSSIYRTLLAYRLAVKYSANKGLITNSTVTNAVLTF